MFFCVKQQHKQTKTIIGESRIKKPLSIHAEEDGLNKLKRIYTETRKILVYDLLVFTIFYNKTLHYSRPCYHCIRKLEKSAFIKIRNVYYTGEHGILKYESLNDLISSADNGTAKISSGYRLRIFGEDKEKPKYVIRNKKIIKIQQRIVKR